MMMMVMVMLLPLLLSLVILFVYFYLFARWNDAYFSILFEKFIFRWVMSDCVCAHACVLSLICIHFGVHLASSLLFVAVVVIGDSTRPGWFTGYQRPNSIFTSVEKLVFEIPYFRTLAATLSTCSQLPKSEMRRMRTINTQYYIIHLCFVHAIRHVGILICNAIIKWNKIDVHGREWIKFRLLIGIWAWARGPIFTSSKQQKHFL